MPVSYSPPIAPQLGIACFLRPRVSLPSFFEFSLLPSLKASLKEQDLTTPTDIQARAIPQLLKRRSLLAVAETGSGKTLAFVLPMLHHIKELESADCPVADAGRPRGLIIVPTRELGEQVGRVLKGLTHDTRLRVRLAIGGTAKQVARQNVKGDFEILVATPGRLQQILVGRKLRLDDIRMLVMDEADQLLDAGFLPVVTKVVRDCPSETQLVMFSATMPKTLAAVIKDVFGEKPLTIETQGSNKVVRTLRTDNRDVQHGRRIEVLRKVLRENPKVGTLLFANTRAQCDVVAEWLDTEGIPYVKYMGQMDRTERRRNLASFREGEVSLLLTTDLGGRGLDIERVDRVVNVHLPKDVDNYLHRVGRTARAGRKGTVVNLVTQRDNPLLAKLKKREYKPH
jgi:superfamily II DNA/RNA helicase